MKFVKNIIFSIIVAAVLLTVISCGEPSPQQAVIKINPQQKFQTITGWEATAQAGESYSGAFENYNGKLFSEAVNDLGINRLRLEIRSGVENPNDYFTSFTTGQLSEEEWRKRYYEVINDNDDPFVINPEGFNFTEIDSTVEKIILPVRKLLAERGESLFVNLNYVDFKGNWRGNSNIRHNENAEEYAEFMLAVYQHLQRKYGFVPDAVEVVLEPDNDTGWTGADIGRVIVATANRLRANNFDPKFIVPSTKNAANAIGFIDEIAKIPDAMQYVSEFAYHRYRGASEKVLEQIAERAANDNKQTSMLEWIGADYHTLHEDLKIGRNSAWQQYTLGFPNEPDNGAQYFLIDDTNAAAPNVKMGSRTKFLRQYFRYIRAGAQRVGAETTNKGLDPLTFINKDGRYVVVIKAAAAGTLTLQGLPAGTYGINAVTQNQANVINSDIKLKPEESLNTNIPSAGVVTIFEK